MEKEPIITSEKQYKKELKIWAKWYDNEKKRRIWKELKIAWVGI